MNKRIINNAVSELQRGNIVCVPTETVYGLAVIADNPTAIAKLYNLKQRPDTKPLAIAIPDLSFMSDWTEAHAKPQVVALVEKYWPGPLTLLLPAKKTVPQMINQNNGIIALRYSSNLTLQAILKQLNQCICLTSANLSGQPAGINAQAIAHNFAHDFMIVKEDSAIAGTPSTIVDLCQNPYKIVRQGAIFL